jgi:hypothetical protein
VLCRGLTGRVYWTSRPIPGDCLATIPGRRSSALGYPELLPQALEIEVLSGEILERRGQFGLPFRLRFLRGRMDLLAHFEPLRTNGIELSNRHATCCTLLMGRAAASKGSK